MFYLTLLIERAPSSSVIEIMRFGNFVSIASLASLTFAPGVVALLGSSCLRALNDVGKAPSLLIEHLQQAACGNGCQPMLGQWDSRLRSDILAGLVEDGAHYCGYPEGQEPLLQLFEKMYDGVTSKCQSEIHDQHLCRGGHSLRPFLDCIERNSAWVVSRSIHNLVPHLTEERCRKGTEYILGDQLWKVDFPKRIKPYVHACHEL